MVAAWAFQSLVFRRTRSILAVAAIGLSTSLVTSTLGFETGFEGSLERSIESMGYQILVTGQGCPHEAATLILRGGTIPMYLREEVGRHIATWPEVEASTRFLMQSVPAPDGRSQQVYVGIDEEFLRLKPSVALQRGEWLSSPSAFEVLLGFNVAEYRRLGPQDEIELQGRKLAVRGVLDRLGSQDDGTVFLPLAVAQELFEKRDRLTGIGIRLEDMSRAAEVIDRLYSLPAIQVVRMAQVQETVLRILSGVRALLTAFGAVCLAVALMGVFNVALITVSERRVEMGVLRALGCPAGKLFRLVWSESLVLSLLGVLLGALLSLLVRGSVEQVVRSTLSFVPSGPVVVLTPGILLGGSAAVVLLCLAAGIYPAWKSSRVSPMVSIRGAAG